ncbi:germination protein YpeB [Halalkalibacter nanhaiisediminis]|uniref:Spore germination protein n=1 Tax=Halalkalibacter nanhaiisediminis TaxID=688079 RepID=A0A562Q7W4_9BACI|nr:germination protein YpeB [Halalkalibacter nanhaiisediminis]TWI52855.1 spore germination protein [Halalkalibacter nanhaiisediminis]
MGRNIVIGLLAVAIVATGIWGFQQQNQNQSIQSENETLKITAENHYQRAFHELAFHIDNIEDQLGSALAMNTRRQLTPAFAEVWRVTSLAQEEIGQLPLNSVDLGQTEEFLYKLGKFSYTTSIRDLDKEPLTDKEYETLKHLYNHSKGISKEIRKSQAMMLSRGDQWLNIEKEMEAGDEPAVNTVASNFKVMNKSVEGFSETEWGAGLAAIDDLNGELKKALNGQEVSKEEAAKIARRYLEMDENVPVNVTKTGNGLAYPAYTIVIDDPEHKTHYNMDMSVKGGEPIWFLQDRQISEQNISLNEAVKKGKAFLEKHGKKNMHLIDSKQYDSIGMLEFVYLEDNVRVYPDSITLEVALDDGDILGYEAKSYLIHHKERNIPKPKLTDDEARAKLNPRLQVMEDHIAIIENDLKEEVLCYEFYGVIEDDTYRIFINAKDGEEEKVEKLDHAETVHNFS